MAMNRKMRSEGGSRRRIRPKDEGSDASDDDYKIEDDQDSDEYCSSLAGEELEDELAEDVKGDKIRVAGRLNMRNATSKNRGRGGKASKKRKVSYEEGSDEEGSDEDFVIEDEDDFSEEEDSKGWMNFPKRKRNGVSKAVKEKKASNMEEKDDNYNAEEDVDDDDDDDDDDDEQEEEDYSDNEGEADLMRGCRGRKQIGIQKANKRKKVPYRKENDDCYKAEDDECEDDEDENYNDNEDQDDLVNGRPRRKRNRVRKALKKKKGSDTEERDDDYEAEDDECDEDDYNEKDLRPSRKQYGIKKMVKRKRGPHTEESDDDYEAEIDESNDDDYGSEEEVDEEEEEEEKEKEVEEDEDDEDFSPNEIEFEDEDEFVVKKSKKVGRTPSQGRRLSRGKKRRNSRVTNNMSKRKEPAKRRGFQRKSSFNRRKQSTKGKSRVKQTSERRHGRKRRRLMVSSDSDFVSSEALLSDQGYSTSEEEREQVREASKFCGHLDVTLRKSSPKKKSEVEENLLQERKHKARKGKDKVEDLKQAAAKQVCGICFSEEGKRTIRGTLDCCSHYFCFNCIMEWSKVESRCPLCKQRFAFLSKPARSDTMFDLRTTVIPIPERDQVYQPSEEELRSYLDPYENVICTECHHGGDDANMLLCDLCDSPAHTYCVGLSEVPEGNWYCEGCRPTALGPTNPQTPHSVRDWRSSTMSARSPPPSESFREAIDLNRVYEPETHLAEGTGVSSSPRPVDGDIRASSWIPSPGVQTVRERRRRHQQMAQFAGRTEANIRLGTEVEWGRTRRLDSQNTIRPETSSFRNSFSQGMSHYNLTSPASNMRLFPASPSHPRAHRVWGQSLTGVNDPTDESVSLQPGPAGITGGDAWSFLGHSSMQ